SKSFHSLIYSIFSLRIHTSLSRRVWSKRHLTWTLRDPFNLIQSPTTLSTIRRILDESFTVWEESLNGQMSFTQIFPPFNPSSKKSKGVDIDILFARGDHGDKDAFDGRGGTVAHSGYPPRGIVHLDADELWTLGEGGVDLRQVVLHELGHVLGLRHSKSDESIMNPFYIQKRRALFIPMIDEYNLRQLYH
ncbi:hypothetical protein PFISCL1PPCAC_10407, partial [Pristionchus fissidentatus]